MTMYTDQRLLELLSQGDQAAIDARETEIGEEHKNTPGFAERITTNTWMEHEHGRDVVESRRLMHEALRDAEQALNAIAHQSNRLSDLYDVDYVEGADKAKVDAAVMHMRLLLDAARHNVPDTD